MASKHFREVAAKEEELAPKLSLFEKQQKDSKDQKDSPDNKVKHEKEKQEKNEQIEQSAKNSKDDKDAPDAKQQMDSKGKDQGKDSGVKAEKDGKDQNKSEHKDHPFETIRQNFAVAAGAAQPAMAPGGPPVAKPLYKEYFKDVLKEFTDHPKDFAKELHLDMKPPLYETQQHLANPASPVEQRLQALEATVGQLLHFIPQELRPDLSKGALRQEADVAEDATRGAQQKTAKPTRRRSKKTTAQV